MSSPRTVNEWLMEIATWPTITTDHLPTKERRIARNREKALRLRAQGVPRKTIHSVTGISRQKLCDLLERACTLAEDGRIQGFRACLYYNHVKEYTRTKPPKKGSNGYAGLLQQTFRQYPSVAAGMWKLVHDETGDVQEVAISDKDLHECFLELCSEAGIKKGAYPFWTDASCDRSLSRTLKKWMAEDLRRYATKYFGEDVARRLGSGTTTSKVAFKIYQRWEFDGHCIDGTFTIRLQLPDGSFAVLVLKRIWLLAWRDCGSEAIVGYLIVLREQYNSEDVLTSFENAIIPWKKRTLSIPGLEYADDGGFPSGTIPELAFAFPNEVTFDNAMAHGRKMRSWVWERIKETLGCQINPGPVAAPEQRLIENWFRIVARNGYQRIVGTTGSQPKDHRRKKNAAEQVVRYEISAEEIEELTDVVIADYNGTLSDGTPGHSPLERLRYLVRDKKNVLVKQVEVSERKSFCLSIMNETRPVVGPLEKGYRPHVNFMGATYSSPKLAASPSLIGKELKLEIRSRDLRTIKAYLLPKGEEFGILSAEGGWALSQHDIRMRRAILRLKRLRKIRVRFRADPIRIYHRYLSTKAAKRKRYRNELAHSRRVSGAGPVVVDSKTTRRATPSKPIQPCLPPIKQTIAPLVGFNV
jgi:hypothetical protein